jgi:hypothetical protein
VDDRTGAGTANRHFRSSLVDRPGNQLRHTSLAGAWLICPLPMLTASSSPVTPIGGLRPSDASGPNSPSKRLPAFLVHRQALRIRPSDTKVFSLVGDALIPLTARSTLRAPAIFSGRTDKRSVAVTAALGAILELREPFARIKVRRHSPY